MSDSEKWTQNEEGLAYGFLMLVLFFIAAPIVIMAWWMIIDTILVTTVNPTIASGGVSRQTAQATAWPINVLKYSIVLVLLTGFVWAANHGIFRRTSGG